MVLLALFAASLIAQSLAGNRNYNNERIQADEPAIGYADYLTSGHFLESVFENWESEFFQMGFYVMLTVFLKQKGSSESKKLTGHQEVDEDPRKSRDDPNAPWPVRRGGWILKVYEHSLGLALILLFLLSFALHGVFGLTAFNEERLEQGQSALSLWGYLESSRFWFESFQNWQSEFLAVASIVILSIYLRERGSPESKAVAAPHQKTGTA